MPQLRLTTIRATPGRLGDILHVVRHSLLPVVRGATGFQGYQLLTRPEDDACAVLTRWASEADLRASLPRGVPTLLTSGPINALLHDVRVEEYVVAEEEP